MLTLIAGGARSGKSRLALRRALGKRRRVFVATARAADPEMEARIARHRIERDEAFETLECEFELVSCLRELEGVDVAVVDCLTLWLSNLLGRGDDDDRVLHQVEQLASQCAAVSYEVIVVSNEVGLGIVPEHPLARRFRDVAGHAHQILADQAHEVYWCALGLPLQLKPGPAQASLGVR